MSDDMNITTGKEADYRRFKTASSRQLLFINMADENSVKMARSQYNNENLSISVCSYHAPAPSAPRTYPLYFKMVPNSIETVLKSALNRCFYIQEYFSIPQDCIEVIFYSIKNNSDTLIASSAAAINHKASNPAQNTNTSAGAIVIISPIVFGGQPTPLISWINYQLARQMIEGGIENLDIDVYHKDFCTPLPNSLSNGSYVISMTVKELLNLDSDAIEELSKHPRPEDSMIIPYREPEAKIWFAEIHKQAEKEYSRQQEILKLLLRDGWQITDCIRRLPWIELGEKNGLEACRITAQFYSFLGAGEYEIRHHIQTWARRNAYTNYQKLKAITTFAMENPSFVGCEHPLLKRFCPVGKCFMAELIEEYEKPHLFLK